MKIGAAVAGCVAAGRRHGHLLQELAKWVAKLEELKFRFAP